MGLDPETIAQHQAFLATPLHAGAPDRAGGGYIFVHRLLMEHFAPLYDGPPEE